MEQNPDDNKRRNNEHNLSGLLALDFYWGSTVQKSVFVFVDCGDSASKA